MTRAGFDLLEVAERYGDACVEYESRLKNWRRGDPPMEHFDKELGWALISAARAYATSTRKKRKLKAKDPHHAR